MILKPEILAHPNIPKPLHGISTRTIEGDTWWNAVRPHIYARYDYHCIACGVAKQDAKKHQWLEAHEFWQIDYNTGICEIESIEPLCHYCHNFIHSGRLRMIMGKEKSEDEVVEILEHGFKILSDNDIKCFMGTLSFGQDIGCNTYDVLPYYLPDVNIPWGQWKLIWKDKEYHSMFASFEAWREFYRRKDDSRYA